MVKNKNIIVLGGNGLIGNAVVDSCLMNGAKVLSVDLNPPNNKIKEVTYLELDLLNDSQKLYNCIIDLNFNFDSIIDCTYFKRDGFGSSGFDDISEGDFMESININIKSIFRIYKPLLELLKKNKNGKLVLLGSIYGNLTYDLDLYKNTNMVPSPEYIFLKAGLHNFSKYLASIYGPHGININVVAAGGVFNNQNIEFVSKYSNKTFLKKMATPKDIAAPCVFLASDHANYITSEVLVVDGGYSNS
jgi:NAD(P)-dependent dehydrogenase (short-subunit alcohol dehydrogenase family)